MAASPIAEPLSRGPGRFERLFPNGEWALLALLAAEIVVFSTAGGNFLSRANAFEIVRMSVELGLLALALTSVIVTGGIDLSVGSMMGLAAVTMGLLWRDHGVPLAAAAAAAILVGAAGGALNALLIARLDAPPLIVTLGTYSLFRGIAEGLTGGADSVASFPRSFLFLGQGAIAGIVPPQAILLAAAVVFYWMLLHRTVAGRGLYAIGHSAAGARYAAAPVARRLTLVYVLSGAIAAAAAVVYVAHVGQAKSDAGTGYELLAITAVVLGGTSIFGGRGSIAGTLLGLLAIVVLQDGLRLAALPAELAGILTGALLIAAIGAAAWRERKPRAAAVGVAILAGVMIAAGGVRAFERAGAAGAGRRLVIAAMPKAKGDPYFESCRAGAEEAARELGADLTWDGPAEVDPAKQNETIEGWITRRVDAIAVSVANQAAISTVLRKARDRGIPVVTWDADSEPGSRDFFVNQATPEGIGDTLTDEAAKILHGEGEIAIVTGALSAANQNEWIRFIRLRLSEKYPKMKLAVIRPSDDDRAKAFLETQTILNVYPNVKVIVGIAAPAVPGAAEAVKQSGRTDVKVVGLSLPNLCKPYVYAGIVEAVVLWNTRDLGYLAVYAAAAVRGGTLKPGMTSMRAGRLGNVAVRGSDVILGAPFVFTRANIGRFDF